MEKFSLHTDVADAGTHCRKEGMWVMIPVTQPLEIQASIEREKHSGSSKGMCNGLRKVSTYAP